MPASHRINSFDALRLLAAWLVIWGHGYILSGKFEEVPRIGGLDASVLGVAIFFVISGYLIWKSWFRAANWYEFLAARVLRIFPALFVVVLVTVLIMGPIVTSLSLQEYFGNPLTYIYLLNVFIVEPQYVLPGVFETLPFTSAVNGSLWTLRAELFCYAAVPLVALFYKKLRPLLLAGVGLYLIWFGMNTSVVVFTSSLSTASLYWGFFALGAFAASVEIHRLRSVFYPIASVGLWLVIIGFAPPQFHVFGFALLAMGVILVGNLNIPVIRDTAKYGDFSYGMYLVAFPLQQMALQYLPELPTPLSIGLVTVVSVLLAWGIWNLIEERAMKQRQNVAQSLRGLLRSSQS
jgi:peptidoglycan/LPS O-acetylase OafA/YrhL